MGNDNTTAEGNEPVKVKNKDIPLLANIFNIMQDIRQIEERREWQAGRLYNITQHLTGMPGGGTPKGLDEAFALLHLLASALFDGGAIFQLILLKANL